MKIKRALVNTVCNLGDRLKPVILKIVPLSVSKKIKQRLINSAYDGSAKKPFEKDAYPYGINLIGFIKAQMGLGEGCRLIARATEVTCIPFGIIETRVGNPFNHNDTTFDDRLMKSAQYGINIFHVNPEQMVPLQLSLPADTDSCKVTKVQPLNCFLCIRSWSSYIETIDFTKLCKLVKRANLL